MRFKLYIGGGALAFWILAGITPYFFDKAYWDSNNVPQNYFYEFYYLFALVGGWHLFAFLGVLGIWSSIETKSKVKTFFYLILGCVLLLTTIVVNSNTTEVVLSVLE